MTTMTISQADELNNLHEAVEPISPDVLLADLAYAIAAASAAIQGQTTTLIVLDEMQQVAAPRSTVDDFINWLDSEDFGDDPTRLRREAWGQ
jgi:hypothetical protein